MTGGFGFLGGRLAHYLLHEGHEILLGTRRGIAPAEHQLEPAKVAQIVWSEPASLDKACSDVDVIIHASGMNSQDCANDPVGALLVNTVGTASLLQAALKQKVRRFIYVSTVHVYASSLHGTISEEHCPSNLHPYAASARAAEDIVLYAQQNRLIDGIVVRLSNGYGVPMHPAVNCWMLLVNNLCRQVAETRHLRLSSDGSQVRNFIPIQEICNVFDFLACRTSLHQRLGDVGPINVGGQRSLTILEMARMVQARCTDLLRFTPELSVQPGPQPSPALQLDFEIQRLLSLGYEFMHDPNAEIDDLLQYCQREFSRS